MPAVRHTSSTRVSHRGHPARVLRLVLLGLLTFGERAFLVLVVLGLLALGEVAVLTAAGVLFLFLTFGERAFLVLVILGLLALGEVAVLPVFHGVLLHRAHTGR